MKHYFLRYVFDDKRELVKSCGFTEFTSECGNRLWEGSPVFTGPLADVPAGVVEGWLMSNRVAGQIFVAKMYGMSNE